MPDIIDNVMVEVNVDMAGTYYLVFVIYQGSKAMALIAKS